MCALMTTLERDGLLDAVVFHPESFGDAPASLQNDRDVVLAAVERNPATLALVPHAFQTDREVVQTAVRKNGYMLQFAALAFRSDYETVKIAVAQNGLSLAHASSELQHNREVVLAALAESGNAGNALKYASAELRANRDVVLAAVAHHAGALEFALPELACEVARDQTVLQRHLADHYVFILSLLSGRTCLVLVPADRSATFFSSSILDMCQERCRIIPEGMEDACSLELLLGGVPAPRREPISKWPGIAPGKAIELQVIVESDGDLLRTIGEEYVFQTPLKSFSHVMHLREREMLLRFQHMRASGTEYEEEALGLLRAHNDALGLCVWRKDLREFNHMGGYYSDDEDFDPFDFEVFFDDFEEGLDDFEEPWPGLVGMETDVPDIEDVIATDGYANYLQGADSVDAGLAAESMQLNLGLDGFGDLDPFGYDDVFDDFLAHDDFVPSDEDYFDDIGVDGFGFDCDDDGM